MTTTQRRRHLINASDAVLELRRTYGVRLRPGTIRQWAARRHIGSHSLRRERYDLREIIRHAQDRGLIATHTATCNTSCQRHHCAHRPGPHTRTGSFRVPGETS